MSGAQKPRARGDGTRADGSDSPVNVHYAKTHLSRILKKVEAGEEVVVARAGKPVAKIVPLEPPRPKRPVFGTLAGKIRIAEDFDDPLPDEILDRFYE